MGCHRNHGIRVTHVPPPRPAPRPWHYYIIGNGWLALLGIIAGAAVVKLLGG